MNGYRQHTEVLGGINCLVLRPENGTPERAAVLCHGFGDQGLDLANCLRDDALAEMALDHRVVFVFPDSPFRVVQTPGWWTPDFSHLVDGNPRCLRDDCPDELPPSRQRIVAVIDDLMAQSGLPAARFVVGGFSQGAVLATDVALSMSDAPAALCVWSGTLINEAEWRPLAAERGFMRVLQTHGREEVSYPFDAAIWLRDLFVGSNFDVEFNEHPSRGNHRPRQAHQFHACRLKRASRNYDDRAYLVSSLACECRCS